MNALFKHRMVVIVGKEVRDPVRGLKAALSVERHDGGCFTGANKHRLIPIPVVLRDISNQCGPVSMPLKLLINGNVLQFADEAVHLSDHTDSLQMIIIVQCEEITSSR